MHILSENFIFSIPRFQALARPASGDFGGEPFTFAGREEEGGERGKDAENGLAKLAPNSSAELQSKTGLGGEASHGKQMPPASVMTRLILIMVWRKLIRNPNTYSSLIGLIWALVAFRLVVTKIINCFFFLNRTDRLLVNFSLVFEI